MRRHVPLIAILALAAGLRLFGIGHGFPETGYVPDTHIVRGALGMAQEKSLTPPSGRYSTYPNLLPYVLLPVYGVQYIGGRATGAWGGVEEFKQRVLLEPALVHGPARVVVTMLGLLFPLAVYLVLVRRRRAGEGGDDTASDDGSPPPLPREHSANAGARCAALVGAYLAATCLLAVHFSVQERPWMPLTAFGLLACVPAATYVRTGRLRSLVWSAVWGAAAAASHQAGLPMLGVAGLAWLFGPLGWSRSQALKQRLVHGVLAVVAFGVFALVVGYNGVLVHGAPEAVAGQALEGQSDAAQLEHDLSIGGQSIVLDVRWASLARLSRALVGYDPVVCLLALVGLVAALRGSATRVPTVFAICWLAFFTTNQNDHVRYLLPGLAFACVPAAVGAQLLYERGGAFGRALLLLLLAVPLVQSARLAWLLDRPDSRELALDVLTRFEPAGVVAIDRYGPVPPPNAASLARIAQWRELGARESAEAFWLAEGGLDDGPLDWVPLGELFVFDERHRGWDFAPKRPAALADLTDPEALLDALGVTHVLLVDRDTSDGVPPLVVDRAPSLPIERGTSEGRPAPKLPPIALAERPIWDYGPTDAELRLPTELDFPLTSLWAVERPGPYLALHARASR